jgi:hypothetical protein
MKVSNGSTVHSNSYALMSNALLAKAVIDASVTTLRNQKSGTLKCFA